MEDFNRENPFFSKLLENRRLNKEGSWKDTRHFSLCLSGSGIRYEPGDSLYVYPVNEASLVEELLQLVQLDLQEEVERKRFLEEVNISRASNKLFKLIESKNPQFSTQEMSEKYNGYNLASIIKDIKSQDPDLVISSNELVENSSKLQPRAYSIASSLKAHPERVELCVARVEEEINGQKILGLCSNYLAERVPLNEVVVKIFIHHNDKFRLPEDSSKDIIMIGPGTGIAPFRAFIEERNFQREQGQQVGRNWLFFGDQRREYDFLYKEEFEAYEKNSGLKLTTAFSRDQEYKIYVQNKMKENSDEIYSWMKNGAYFYVCGDAKKMAKDVDQALREIFEVHGENSEAAMKELKDSKRYCRDVY
jgi:sulfite reductase (NADPH) flavoprotein alpha-component